ncbi:MAG TPA: SDR family oxidoreductase [Gammaproteobacteria bacterium]
MQQAFKNKVALVTGGSLGIGFATAIAFAEQGAKVVIADVKQAEGESAVDKIKQAGGDALFIKADVSSNADVEAMLAKTVAHYGRLDCAVNNAGIDGEHAPTAECSEDNWDRTIAINLKGVWLCMKYEIQQMLRQGSGAIVNLASVAGVIGFQGLPAYCASKGGVIQLTRTAALEYAKQGIRVNAVCPGVIRTPMVENMLKDAPDLEPVLLQNEPVGRMGTPEEMADAILWLCSEQSSFVTGHPLLADGGWTAQ